MDLSISIVSWNTRDLLDQCLKSVYDNTNGIECEVIVVDNASSDGSAGMVRAKYPLAKLIANTGNVGFAEANNQAYAVSTGRSFLLLNPDTVVRGNVLKTLVEFLDNHDRAGAVGPLVVNDDGSLQYSWARFPTLWSEAMCKLDRRIEGLARPPTTTAETRSLEPFMVDWVGGCCLMVKRRAMEQIGAMDESLFMYFEETDWCLRLHKAEWEVWVEPAAEIMHYGGRSSQQASESSQRQLVVSKARYFHKHKGRVHACVVMGVLVPKSWLGRKLRGIGRWVSGER